MLKIFTWVKFLYIILLSNIKSLKYPYKLFLVVTKACDSRCGNCLIWKEKVEDELTLDEYKLMAMGIGKNLYWLNISGGEPTNRKDLIPIISAFIENCPNLLCINFTTNALNLPELFEVSTYLNTVKVPVIRINVSVDGPEKIHDKMRGRPGNYKKAVEALGFILRLKNIKAMAAMTLHDQNKEYIEDTFSSLIRDVPGFQVQDFHVNLSQSSQHYYGNLPQKNLSNFPESNLRSLFKKASPRYLSPVAFIERVYRRKISEYLETRSSPIRCAAMSGNLYVSEKGSIFPCTIWNKEIGSLREKAFNFKEILESDSYIATRKEVLMKKCPGCWTPCEAYPSIMGDLLGSLR